MIYHGDNGWLLNLGMKKAEVLWALPLASFYQSYKIFCL